MGEELIETRCWFGDRYKLGFSDARCHHIFAAQEEDFPSDPSPLVRR